MSCRFAGRAACRHVLWLAASLSACERRPADARADAAAPVAQDTIVRRVGVLYRAPSAIQRVTGPVTALHALRPLDSALAVRVMDQRGRELSGVRVSWTLFGAGEGAELRVLNARTDSAGVSSVAFTPGRTALAQSVVAEVARVGSISFDVIVQPASIRLHADPASIWSGDDAQVSAELRDVAGVELSEGALVWGSTDSTVVGVTPLAGGARVRGRLAGAAEVVAWIEPGRVRGNARLTVKPIVSGEFVTIDGSPVPALTMTIAAGDIRDSIPVVDSRFSSKVDLSSHAGVELRASPSGTGLHPVHIRIAASRALQGMTIALVPTSWRIEAGTYRGQTIPIDAARALRRASTGSFWRLATVNRGLSSALVGWPERAMPLRIAFNRAASNERISADDSIAFWRIARQMEADLGERLFVPAEIVPDSASSGIVPVELHANAGEGHTLVTWNDAGEAFDGVLMFRRSATLRDAHVVTHELLHLISFGHATSFRSVSQAVGGTEPRLTPEDVAYAQVALRLQRLQARGTRAGLPVASQ
jgi:hypothetical protein